MADFEVLDQTKSGLLICRELPNRHMELFSDEVLDTAMVVDEKAGMEKRFVDLVENLKEFREQKVF